MSQGISTIVHIVSTVILARMLTPADYGIIAMVTAITSFAGLFRDLGLSTAAIQKKDLTSNQQTSLFWLNVAMGTLLTGIVAAGAPLVSWFYQKPELTLVTIALSLNFLIGSFGSQHGAMLTRNMQFERKAVASISGAIVSLVIAVVFASMEYGYWALVASSLVGGLVTTILLFVLSPFWPGIPGRARGVREMVTFGAHVTAFELVNYFHRNLDNILIGRVWGSESLGIYSRAYALLMMPIQSIRGPIISVLFPALSRLQTTPASFRSFFLTSAELNAYICLPLIGFLYMSSSEIVELMLGSMWERVGAVFAWLAIPAALDALLGLAGSVMLALGQVRKRLIIASANAAIVSLVFLASIHGGIEYLAKVYAIANAFLFLPRSIAIFRGTPVKVTCFLKTLFAPAAITIAACIGTAVLRTDSSNALFQVLCLRLALYGGIILALDAVYSRYYVRGIAKTFHRFL